MEEMAELEEIAETDVGRMLAAAAPAADAVPPVGDLAGRARMLGRRRRVRLIAARSGGAGIAVAAVAGIVVALGGFGSGGQSLSAGSSGGAGQPGPPLGTHAAGPAQGQVPPGLQAVTPSRTVHSILPPSKPLTENSPMTKKVLDAVKAALPAKDAAGLTVYRDAGGPMTYGAEYNWGPREDQAGLTVAIGTFVSDKTPHTPTMCTSDPGHCTTGTATLLGQPVRWEYYVGNPHYPAFDVYNDRTMVVIHVDWGSPSSRQPIGLDELKAVGLNGQVAEALMN